MGYLYRKKVGEAEIGSAEQQAKKIVDEGVKLAETRKKEALLEAKEEILAAKNENEREAKERRNELNKLEKRMLSKEETLERKMESLERKDETLNRKIKENADLNAQIEEIKNQQLAKLEEVAGLTSEQAKEELLSKLENEVRHEAAMRIIEVESQFREEADAKAKEIITTAIQRCAADQVSESTVSVVTLPSDDM